MNDHKSTTYRISNDPTIRFCAFYVLLFLGSLIVGGPGIFLIVFGLMFFFTRVLARTSIGQTSISRFFDYKKPDVIVAQSPSRIYKILTTSIRFILFSLYIYGSLLLIWFGIKLLVDYGFLNQNLIYILFLKFK